MINSHFFLLFPSETSSSENKLCSESSLGLEIKTCPPLNLPLHILILARKKDPASLLGLLRIPVISTSTQLFDPIPINLLSRTQPPAPKHPFPSLIV